MYTIPAEHIILICWVVADVAKQLKARIIVSKNHCTSVLVEWFISIGCTRRAHNRSWEHTTARDGCRRGNCQILNLKDHIHQALHGNNLSTVEAELLVVIQNCVHVLNPDGIHRSAHKAPMKLNEDHQPI
jgi:hypothetical protein